MSRLLRADANAGGEMVRLDLNQRRHDLFASLNRVRTTGVKTTAGGRIDWRRHVALEHYALSRRFDFRIGNRHREISAFV